MSLKVLSWNIWVDCHFDEFKKFIGEASADIIGMQEVREGDPERDVVAYMRSIGYEHVFVPEQIWRNPPFRFGPAIFSKYKIASSAIHTLSDEDKRYAVQADIEVENTILHVFSTHLTHTHQLPSENQEKQVDDLIRVLPKDRTIVMGDFNATPDSSVIQKMSSALNNTDPSNAPTWSMDPEGCPVCKPEGVTIRLDYIFASKDLKVSNPKVEHSTASDHLPISAEIEL